MKEIKNSRHSWALVCILSPPSGGCCHNPSLSTGMNGLPPLTQVCVFSFFFCDFFKIFFYLISRLKQVSLSLELEMRYTTAPFALTDAPHFVNITKTSKPVWWVDKTTTRCMADPQEHLEKISGSHNWTKALKQSQIVISWQLGSLVEIKQSYFDHKLYILVYKP